MLNRSHAYPPSPVHPRAATCSTPIDRVTASRQRRRRSTRRRDRSAPASPVANLPEVSRGKCLARDRAVRTVRPTGDRALIAELHSYARPAGSKTERSFIRQFIEPLGATPDAFGNWHVVIGDPNPTILWSCHTDTVATRDGRQRVVLTEAGILALHPAETRRNCLGADDTAGIWILREMIAAGIPGRYVFHYAEERGALGSGDLAYHTPELLDGITCAVAFDRAGTGDVITYQRGDRCASDAFAWSVSDALNAVALGLLLEPADGIFTDTASYMDLVPECTNLSVGYAHAHSAAETLDTNFLIALRDAMLAVDVASWVIARDPLAQQAAWGVDLAEPGLSETADPDDPWSSPFETEADRIYWNRLFARYR